jgi:hypothetical protein
VKTSVSTPKILSVAAPIVWFLSMQPGPLIAAPPGDVLMTVTSNGESKIRHPVGYPLAIDVTLSNPAASNLILDAITAQSEQRKSRPQEADVPVVGVGANDKPILKAITLSITGPAKNAPHPLVENKMVGVAIRLDGHDSARIVYGFDVSDLPTKSGAKLVIAAKLDETAIEPRRTAVDSKPLRIELISPNELDPRQKIAADYAAGRYFIADQKYNEVAPCADRLERSCPQLGAALRAEMYFGLGDMPKAREACRQALTLYAQNVKGETDAEPPMYLFELLKQIDETKR